MVEKSYVQLKDEFHLYMLHITYQPIFSIII